MIRIKVVFIGKPILGLRKKRLSKWKSKLFNIIVDNRNFYLNSNCVCDIGGWGYSDKNLQRHLPNREQIDGQSFDMIFYVLNVPLQDNYFSRIINDNRILVSFYQIKHFLQQENIPLENYIISLIYTYVLLYKGKQSGSCLSMKDEDLIAHDFSEGCLFDMRGIKREVVHSCIKPIICEECTAYLKRKNVSIDDITQAKKEMKRIQRDLYYRIIMFLKQYPVWSVIISGIIAVVLNIIANVIYNDIIYPFIK